MSLVTVLVAEDNSDDYLILEHAFERASFIADRRRVRDGLEAKAYLAGQVPFSNRALHPMPSLVIADLKMPRMNGLELLHWTRRQPIIKRIPFVILSASGRQADVDAAYESCVNSYHVKPNRLDDLISLLRHLRDYWFNDARRPDIADDFVAAPGTSVS
jgi:CheY-like chemotaxis protein